jgi:hypothetical protein
MALPSQWASVAASADLIETHRHQSHAHRVPGRDAQARAWRFPGGGGHHKMVSSEDVTRNIEIKEI